MKVKKSKHLHHYRDGYTPVVRCHLNLRHKVLGADKDVGCTGVSVAFPQKVDIEQMAISASNATTSTSYQKLNEYVERREMERVPRIKGCFRPTKGNFGRE